jgi:ATP-dependent Lhr-like helicase
VLSGGELLGWLGRSEKSVVTFLPEAEPERSRAALALAGALADRVARQQRRAVLIATLDREPAQSSPLAPMFREAGFSVSAQGLLLRAFGELAPRRGSAGLGAARSTPRRT